MAQVIHVIDMRSLPQAGQTFFKAIEAMNNGHQTIGLQYLQALSHCAFPQVSKRARDALGRYQRDKMMEGGAA